MSDPVADFYRVHVPAQYNATLTGQRAAATSDPAARALLEEMEAVRASIVVRVDGATFGFDIERGTMTAVDAPARPPFLVMRHAADEFDAIHAACGDSLLGFLGALAGLGEDMRITSQRVRSLRDLAGGVRLAREGEGGFTLDAWFGAVEVQEAPQATIRLDAETFARLRAGRLDPQDAFLAGAIPIEGDEGLAIGLALAAMSPE
ncbi:MAG: SCP2 sterol-binding domain-containing protein [Myxococcota bacterium]